MEYASTSDPDLCRIKQQQNDEIRRALVLPPHGNMGKVGPYGRQDFTQEFITAKSAITGYYRTSNSIIHRQQKSIFRYMELLSQYTRSNTNNFWKVPRQRLWQQNSQRSRLIFNKLKHYFHKQQRCSEMTRKQVEDLDCTTWDTLAAKQKEANPRPTASDQHEEPNHQKDKAEKSQHHAIQD